MEVVVTIAQLAGGILMATGKIVIGHPVLFLVVLVFGIGYNIGNR
jgi:hypothetical protein